MDTVYVVQHVRPATDAGDEDVKMIGAYRSRVSALAAVHRLAALPGFCNHPQVYNADTDQIMAGFCIDAYELDQDHWSEGFGGGEA
jgi:hypothetical protein